MREIFEPLRDTRAMRRLAAALLCALLAVPSLAASIVAEGTATVGGAGAAGARRTALAEALSEAVHLLIQRHVPREALAAHEREISSRYLSRPTAYILRHAIISEAADAGEVRVRIAATVDEEKLLGDLAGLGLPVKRLEARPRVLLAAAQGEDSAAAAKGVGDRLMGEGFTVRFHPKAVAAGGEGVDPAAWAKAAGCHFALVVSAEVTTGDAEERGAGDRIGTQPLVRAWGRGRGWVAAAGGTAAPDLAVDGAGAAATEEDARKSALQSMAETLAQRFLAEMTLSGWTPGGLRETFEIHVGGLTSPGQVETLTQAFGAVTEIRTVELTRVERGAAQWRVEAVRSGFGWAVILGTIPLTEGTVVWEEPAPAPGAPVRVNGRWAER